MNARPTAHRNALLFLNGGLGNGIILAPLLAAVERTLPGLRYWSPPNAVLEADWVREPLGLRGPIATLPTLWRRFRPADQPAIVEFCQEHDVTLIINLRYEEVRYDGDYLAFRESAAGLGIECWDLHELSAEEKLQPFGTQSELHLRRHGVATDGVTAAWLASSWRPRPGLTGICVGASIESKRWPASRWSELIDDIGPVEVCSGPHEAERAIARELADRHPDQVTLCLPETTTELRDWIGGLSRLVTNDSLALHLAAALGCPTVGLYLVTDSRIWSPVAVPGRFRAVQSQPARECEFMRVNGTCANYYQGCFDVCRDGVTAADVRAALNRLDPADVSAPGHHGRGEAAAS
ncbi:glycosyltransferase family 9 protein [Streptomyces olivaceoviridis]|uniref:glycosyltransferase family 9 protein n=1 Tax=Streptomyces olivaceoviridis TaxID=1921 RepID=UPI0016785B0A|nr:glycosyltransferase family 9 protein [Streptomyces olivaceoviridis]GGZ01300.1 hypothetical protein GCM10010300_51610 [Streptomyces olivaceoviridis]